jgi:penicillin-binding protein 1C
VPAEANPVPELVRPTEGLQIAYDPRIPAAHQKFRFEIKGMPPGGIAEWMLDGVFLARGEGAYVLWPVEKGRHTLSVKIVDGTEAEQIMGPVNFSVK